MSWLLTAVLCAALVELALRLPFPAIISALSRAGNKAVRVLRSKSVSDHWKEKALAAYAQTTFVSTLKLAGLLITFFAIAAAVVLILDYLLAGFQKFILSWPGIAFSIFFASLYFKIRRSLLRGPI